MQILNRTAHIRHQCRKTIVLSRHRCLINTGVEKNEQHLNKDYNLDQKMYLSKSKCWYSNNKLYVFKHAVQLYQKKISQYLCLCLSTPYLL